ncbi:MAG: aminotransferase class IV [Bacteriovoracales bacterium]
MILENFVFSPKKIFQDIDITNNGLLLNERVFTSFRTFSNKVPFLVDHMNRLDLGAKYLFGKDLEKKDLLLNLRGLLKTLKEDIRVRITILKINDELDYFISTSHLENFNTAPISLTKSEKIKTSGLIPSFLKTGNYVETNLEVERARNLGFDDIVFTDLQNNILECSTSNIFIIKNNNVFTPAVNDLFLNGITRQKIIEMLKKEKINIQESEINYSDLMDSDEVFICNSVKGIRSVGRVEKIEFNNIFTKEIIAYFNDYIRKNRE